MTNRVSEIMLNLSLVSTALTPSKGCQRLPLVIYFSSLTIALQY